MPEITAGDEFHHGPLPASTRDVIQADAPALVGLLEAQPQIHIYTQSNPNFAEISKFRVHFTDDSALAVVKVTSEAEIAATVTHCAAAGLALAIRSGGNDIHERSRVHGGVVVDVRAMDSMVLAADRQSVRLGGGTTSGNLLKFLDTHGLSTPVSWGHQIGYVGWACGGGYGLECGPRGLGVDQILAGRIVTASGKVLAVNADGGGDDEDAWWTLRGVGAGAIGVVSELTIKVYPRPRALAGYVWFPYAEAEKVFANMQKLYSENFPNSFAGEVFMIDPQDNGGVVNHFFWWDLNPDGSDLEEAKSYHQRITECGTVILDTVKSKEGVYSQMTPYEFLYSVPVTTPEGRATAYNTSLVVPGFSPELGAILARHPLPYNKSVVVLHNCHGAGTCRDPTMAFSNREQHAIIGIASQCAYEDEELRKRIKDWPYAVYDEIVKAGLSTGWKYTNFNDAEPGDGKMYLGEEGVNRLRRVKEKLDPKNLFAKSTPDLKL